MKQKKSLTGWKHLKTEQISTRILYSLVGVTTVLFVLFYLVGYDMPFMYEPEYNAPLFTDVLLSFMYLMVAAAVAVAAFAVVRGYRRRTAQKVVNGIPAWRIAWGTVGLLMGLLVLTFLLGSSSPLTVNGKPFADVFWLKTTDMFIYTTLILMLVATAAVCLSMSGLSRRKKKTVKGEGNVYKTQKTPCAGA